MNSHTNFANAARSLLGNLPEDAELTQFIINAAEVAINYCSADFTIVFANKTYAAIHDRTPEQIIGRKIIEIIGTDAFQSSYPYYERALKGERVVYEMELHMPVGSRYVQCIYNPVTGREGQVLGWVGVIIDMTERHKLEKALQENKKKLQLEKDRAEAANVAKTEFLANMSHELRTPMNAVIGLLNIMLGRDIAPDKQKEYLRVMQISAQQLLGLINDLLDVSKLEVGQAPLEEIAFSLEELLQEVIAVHQVQARQKSVALDLESHSLPQGQLIGDPLRIRQVLLNLVSNALKFTEHGSVKLIAEGFGEIDRKQKLQITVKDSGIGIAKEQQENIFNQFTQADGSIRRTYGGTGLGLYISKMLLDMMGGAISLQSQPGQGSQFTITLALPLVEKKIESDVAGQLEHAANKSMHILLVEDNVANLMVTSSLLEMVDHTYEIARNGYEALKKFKEKKFDAILMDVQMPEMDGIEATRQMREIEALSNAQRTPIIGLTAHAFVEDRERCLAIGMDNYLTKPFNSDVLISTLEQYA